MQNFFFQQSLENFPCPSPFVGTAIAHLPKLTLLRVCPLNALGPLCACVHCTVPTVAKIEYRVKPEPEFIQAFQLEPSGFRC